MPEISVIVVTRDRRALLDRTLSHLLAQTPPPASWELIVVDSSRSPLAVVDPPASVDVRLVGTGPDSPIPRSAATARNMGAELAKAKRLCFLDDDMLTPPGFLHHHLGGTSTDDEVLLGYRYLAEPSTVLPAPGAPFVVAEDWTADERDPYLRNNGDRANWGCLYSHNFSISRRAFETIGGFDETFVGSGGEDIELGYRLHCAGMTFRISRNAFALHQHHPRSSQRWRDNAANLSRLVEIHPELRDFAAEVRRGWSLRPEFHAALAEAT